MRDAGAPLLRNDVTRNPWVWAALVLCSAMLLCAAHVPPLARVLALEPIGRAGGWLVLGFSVAPLVAGEGVRRAFERARRPARERQPTRSEPKASEEPSG
jgi:Ca2+-transporting ATPase